MPRIPFNKPFTVGCELEYVRQATESGRLCGDGPFTEKCERLIEERYGARSAVLTHSCTAALEMAALLCEVGPGDEVIMPSFTFVSTANAFALRGARPRFVDIRPDTLNLDEKLIEAAVNEQTRAIAPVHYAGVGCEMDAIMDVAARHDLQVVEDAAQAVGARFGGRYLGTIGDLGTYSFHETKNVVSGEGGALLVNAPELRERAEIIHEKGTNRKQFMRGEVSKYEWVDIGSSFLPSEITAAFLYAQLEAEERIRQIRRSLWELYHEALADLESQGFISRPSVPDSCEPNGHLYYILTRAPDERQALIKHLAAHEIQAVFHYVPLHTAPVGRELGYREGDLPVTEDLARRLLRLPLYPDLREEDLERVVEAVRGFYGAAHGASATSPRVRSGR